MARILREKDYAEKKNEILDAAQKLIYMRGYKQMTIQGILAEVGISKGAFYHYFDSKESLLEALIDRLLDEGERMLQQIAEKPETSALEKLQSYFSAAGRWKTAQKSFLLELVHVWYQDENAIVRQKVYQEGVRRTAPILSQICIQGFLEGSINNKHTDRLGELVMCLVEGLGQRLAWLLLAVDQEGKAYESACAVVNAYQEALERVLGLAEGSLTIVDENTMREWFEMDSSRLFDASEQTGAATKV